MSIPIPISILIPWMHVDVWLRASTNTATDTEVLTNVIENFEQAKQIRDQLNALIDWYESSVNK
jgi:hypothetical protein